MEREIRYKTGTAVWDVHSLAEDIRVDEPVMVALAMRFNALRSSVRASTFPLSAPLDGMLLQVAGAQFAKAHHWRGLPAVGLLTHREVQSSMHAPSTCLVGIGLDRRIILYDPVRFHKLSVLDIGRIVSSIHK